MGKKWRIESSVNSTLPQGGLAQNGLKHNLDSHQKPRQREGDKIPAPFAVYTVDRFPF
jgi:hypothetical protein